MAHKVPTISKLIIWHVLQSVVATSGSPWCGGKYADDGVSAATQGKDQDAVFPN